MNMSPCEVFFVKFLILKSGIAPIRWLRYAEGIGSPPAESVPTLLKPAPGNVGRPTQQRFFAAVQRGPMLRYWTGTKYRTCTWKALRNQGFIAVGTVTPPT
jgi:hypothetical protein